MQQPTHPLASGPSMPPANITTEQIQKYLDENKQLILAILENQQVEKMVECAQYQAQLQKNLLFLAAIADAQPQAPAVRPQMMPHAAMQQGGYYMPQSPGFPPRVPFNPQQVQQHQQQQQQQQQQHQLHHQPQLLPFQGHMGMRPGVMNGMHTLHAEASHGGSGDLPPGSSMAEFSRGGTPSSSVDGRGSKQEAGGAESAAAAAAATDSHRSTAAEHRSGDVETAHMKRPGDGKTP